MVHDDLGWGSRVKLLLVEDEVSAARRLTRLVAEHLGAGASLVHAKTVAVAVDLLHRTRFDGVLLDLNLEGADGFAVIDAVEDIPVVVVSAHADRSLEAFDHAVLDFVAKPVVPARLNMALDRLAALRTTPRRASLVVRSLGKAEIVDCERVMRIQGADDYAELFLDDGRRLLHDGGLALLERRLPTQFARTHRSHIVNILHATAIVRDERGAFVRLSTGELIAIGRRRVRDVERWLGAIG